MVSLSACSLLTGAYARSPQYDVPPSGLHSIRRSYRWPCFMSKLNLYELVKLGADSLVYRTLNKPREEMETFEYSRWKEPEKLDLHGLQLEDAADEFHL